MSYNFTLVFSVIWLKCPRYANNPNSNNSTTCGLRNEFCNISDISFNDNELTDYYCRYESLLESRTKNDYICGRLYLIGSVFGTLGCFLTICVLLQRKFWLTSFIYHRALTIAEIICMIVLVLFGAQAEWSTSPAFKTALWQNWLKYGAWKIGNSMKSAGNFIVVFMSLERAIALWLPFAFKKINTTTMAITFITTSWLIGCVNIADGFKDDYSKDLRDLLHRINNAFQMFAIIAITLLTILIVLGIRIAARRHQMLSSDSHQWETTKQLCYLQMIVATFIIFDLSTTIAYDILTDGIRITGRTAVQTLTYERAMSCLIAEEFIEILLVVNTVAEVTDQCSHFYLYMLFCTRFREGFLLLIDRHVFLKLKASVEPTKPPVSEHRAKKIES